jgi:hypothetical protein
MSRLALNARCWLPVALVLVGLAMPSASLAVPGRGCDARGGRTLSANQSLRLYAVSVRGSKRQLRVCAYRSKRDVSLSPEGPQRSFGDLVYAIGGHYAVAIQYRTLSGDDVTNRSPDVGLNSSLAWDGRRDRFVGEPEMPTGYKFQWPVVSEAGVVAAIADPQGKAYADNPDDVPTPRAQSAVITSNLVARGAWQPIANGSPGSLTGLTLSGSSLVWSANGQLASAPLVTQHERSTPLEHVGTLVLR